MGPVADGAQVPALSLHLLIVSVQIPIGRITVELQGVSVVVLNQLMAQSDADGIQKLVEGNVAAYDQIQLIAVNPVSVVGQPFAVLKELRCNQYGVFV